MLSKILEYIGIFFIITFSAVSIFFALAERDMENPQIRDIMSYTSFFEDRFYDIRMRMTLDDDKTDKRIALAAIDDQSLDSIGRWPWTRTTWTKILKKLDGYGAKIVAFDVFFAEPEKPKDGVDPDKQLAEAIRDFQSQGDQRVILPYRIVHYPHEGYEQIPGIMYNTVMNTKQGQGMNLRPVYVGKSVFPVKELINANPELGHIGVEEDPDGIFRHYPVVANVDTLYFPSFALSAYQSFTGDNPTLEMLSVGDANLQLKTGTLNLNYKGEAKVRWFGDQNNFPYVSMKKIMNAPPDNPELTEKLKGSMVFIGSTAFGGAHDLRHTPINPRLPGVYFHMNMTHMLLEGKFFAPESQSTLYSWLLLFSGTLLMIVVMLWGNAVADLVTVIGITLGFFFLDAYYLLPRGYEIKLFFCLFSPIACYSWSTFLHFYRTTKEKKKIRGTFSRYVAPAIVDQMLKDPDAIKLGGEKKNITVFFSDVRDFTTISENLTPEQLSTCLNQYMTAMTDIVFDYNGTVDKYIGDAIVAYWGAPLDVPNHAYKAVKASIDMIEKLPEVNKKFREQGFPEFQHGIGLNTGECSVGNMGSEKIFSYTALGDHMNLGARAEALCKFYGVQLNITENTKNAIPEDLQKEFKFRILDKVRVKGKEIPVVLWEVLHPSHHLYNDDQALDDYDKAFQHYQNQHFQEAIDLLSPYLDKYPHDKSFARVHQACLDFLTSPPPTDWDGAYTHTTKS